MHIYLTRYYQSPFVTKSTFDVDGILHLEAREPSELCAMPFSRLLPLLPPGTYACQCVPSDLSPITLRVNQQAVRRPLLIGYDEDKQWQIGRIHIGFADCSAPPEERELICQRAAFDSLTQRLYEVYARKEPILLTVIDKIPTAAPEKHN